ncbi:MAG: MBL fold metallo-hydrolase [Clostridium sp.]
MSDFRIKTYVLGGVSTNCYLVFREGEKTAVIIDPADNADYLKNKCREFGVKPEAVLLTHAHFDHMLAADDIRKAYGCKVYVHMDDERMLNDPFLNLSGTMGTEQTGISADHLLRDGDVLHFLNREWKVMATPGHTARFCLLLPAGGEGAVQRRYPVCGVSGTDGSSDRKHVCHCSFHRREASGAAG